MIRTVAIVGAGFAGLSTAKVLKDRGFEVTLFEKEPDVGGVWAGARRYPGLTTQNPKSTYAFSDFPMPSDYPEWPTGAQVQRYLASYADHFALTPRIALGTEVLSATYSEGAQRWSITARTSGVQENEGIARQFDYLVVCNGIFSRPLVPSFAGEEAFRKAGGTLCHTSEFTDAARASGKHVWRLDTENPRVT